MDESWTNNTSVVDSCVHNVVAQPRVLITGLQVYSFWPRFSSDTSAAPFTIVIMLFMICSLFVLKLGHICKSIIFKLIICAVVFLSVGFACAFGHGERARWRTANYYILFFRPLGKWFKCIFVFYRSSTFLRERFKYQNINTDGKGNSNTRITQLPFLRNLLNLLTLKKNLLKSAQFTLRLTWRAKFTTSTINSCNFSSRLFRAPFLWRLIFKPQFLLLHSYVFFNFKSSCQYP